MPPLPSNDGEATIVLPLWLKTLRGAEKCCKEREIEDKEFLAVLAVHFLAGVLLAVTGAAQSVLSINESSERRNIVISLHHPPLYQTKFGAENTHLMS